MLQRSVGDVALGEEPGTEAKEYATHEGDGHWQDWTEWTVCKCDGMQRRSRTFLNNDGPSDTKYESRQCAPNIICDFGSRLTK